MKQGMGPKKGITSSREHASNPATRLSLDLSPYLGDGMRLDMEEVKEEWDAAGLDVTTTHQALARSSFKPWPLVSSPRL